MDSVTLNRFREFDPASEHELDGVEPLPFNTLSEKPMFKTLEQFGTMANNMTTAYPLTIVNQAGLASEEHLNKHKQENDMFNFINTKQQQNGNQEDEQQQDFLDFSFFPVQHAAHELDDKTNELFPSIQNDFPQPLPSPIADDSTDNGLTECLTNNTERNANNSMPSLNSLLSAFADSVESSTFSLPGHQNSEGLSEDKSSTEKQKTKETHDRFKPFHEEKWNLRYKELLKFIKDHGHGAVPHTYPENPPLARWVKRQRRQYKLRQDGKTSTMTAERVDLLNCVGFVWDSHEVAWREKFEALKSYQRRYGNSNVPSNHEDKKLATWVKCQRRQYKLYWQGKTSAMCPQRIDELEGLGFEWEIRVNLTEDVADVNNELLRQTVSEF